MNFVLLVGVIGDDTVPGTGPMGPVLRERLILLGAILFVASVSLAWAAFIRRRDRRHRHQHHDDHHQQAPVSAAAAPDQHRHALGRHKRRKRRRPHRPRNPTLAETGGLPPTRDNEPPGSAPTLPQ